MNNNKKNYHKSDYEIEKLMDFFCDYMLNFSNISVESLSQLESIFKFILRFFECSRCYIYEIEKESIVKVFEVCSDLIEKNAYRTHKEPLSVIKSYLEHMSRSESVVISDIETLEGENLELYTINKAQGIRTCIFCPIIVDQKLIGFIGLDNPKMESLELGAEFVNRIVSSISFYIMSQIKNRKTIKKLHYESKETDGLKNLSRISLNLTSRLLNNAETLGLVYCHLHDKEANLELLMREAYIFINNYYSHDSIYSIGEEDFVIICKNIGEEHFYNLYEQLQKSTEHLQFITSASWKDRNIDFNSQFTQLRLKVLRTKPFELSIFNDVEESYSLNKNSSAFKNYTKNNYFDAEVLIRSIANPNSLNYIFFGDLQTNVFYISDNMVKKFGFEGNIIKNFLVVWENSIYSPKELELYRNDIRELTSQRKKVHNLRYRVKDASGEKVWIHCQGEVLWDKTNTKMLFFSGCVSCQEDEFLIDPITSFPRESFAIRKLSSLCEENVLIRIIGFSLNNFNEINELWGKTKGDKLLSDIARQLSEEYSGKINFYRLDGLRFAAILQPNMEEGENLIIKEIREIILKYYRSHNVTVQSPCSFCYMTAKPREMAVQDMISNTILLINIAKSSMEDSFIAYSAQSIKEKKHYAEMVLEITKNIQNDFENFRLVIQPTFRVEDHTIKGGEALLRWKFKGSNIPPAEFIPILEKTKLINIVGRWVLKNVVKITKRLLEINQNIKLSFNVSYTQIYDENFFDYLSSVLEEYDVDASKLVLELTETNFNENPQKLADFFNTCIGYGLDLALDDFGSGYSSIGLLLKYPTSIVKLDKSLLYEISHSDVNQKFIKSIINSCHLFGKEVCAEGVETKLELEMMKEAECDIIQGFYFSKPLELPDFFNLIAENRAKE